MNVDRIEREMAYARAKLALGQKNIIDSYADTAKLRSMLTGLFIGFVAATIGIMVGVLVFVLR